MFWAQLRCFCQTSVIVIVLHIENSLRLENVMKNICTYLSASRDVVSFLQTNNSVLMWSRSFSSDSGELVVVVVPFMGESITDGTLAAFLKKPGDHVNIDEPITQVETDKVTIDVASPETGVIHEFVAKEGDTVEPGTKIAIISKSGEGVTHVAPSEKAPSKAASEPTLAEKLFTDCHVRF